MSNAEDLQALERRCNQLTLALAVLLRREGVLPPMKPAELEAVRWVGDLALQLQDS